MLCVASFTFLGAGAAMANSPSPTGSPPGTGTKVTNPDGSVTVSVHGNWVWLFATSSKEGTEGLHATVSDKCDNRFGGGFGIVWNDPNDPGYHETFTEFSYSASVNLGSRGVNPSNTESGVTWTKGSPCGTFVQTNKPIPGAGNVDGTWAGVHTYANAAAVPAEICVVTFDLGSATPPKKTWLEFSNPDNSITWSLLDFHSWNAAPDGSNCLATSNLTVVAPPPPVMPTRPAKVTSVTTPPPPPPAPPVKVAPTPAPAPAPAVKVAPTPAPATKPTGVLAFTGFGPLGQWMTLGGAILVIIGLLFYFVDMRKVLYWFLGH